MTISFILSHNCAALYWRIGSVISDSSGWSLFQVGNQSLQHCNPPTKSNFLCVFHSHFLHLNFCDQKPEIYFLGGKNISTKARSIAENAEAGQDLNDTTVHRGAVNGTVSELRAPRTRVGAWCGNFKRKQVWHGIIISRKYNLIYA